MAHKGPLFAYDTMTDTRALTLAIFVLERYANAHAKGDGLADELLSAARVLRQRIKPRFENGNGNHNSKST